MSARALLEVLLKFWGVVMLASTLTSLPSLFYFTPQSTPDLVRTQAFALAVGAVVAVCLLFFAPRLSRLLMPSGQAAAPDWAASNLLEVALVALGVFFIVSGLKLVVFSALELLRAQTWVKAGLQDSIWARERFNFVSGVTELIAGGLLLRFRLRLVQWLPGRSEEAA